MAKKEKAPHIEVVKTPKGLQPHMSEDAEKLMSASDGTVYSLVPVAKRSLPQLRTYWKALGIVAKATGKWSSPENLHRDIKMTLGYYEQSVNIRTGEVLLVPDSVGLDKMGADEFRVFMDKAMALLADAVGFDPLAFLNEAN
jgi:hypothetical protein